MIYHLRSQVALAFALIAILAAGLTTLAANILLKNHFRQYIVEQLQEENANLANLIGLRYLEHESAWADNWLEEIGMAALQDGLIIRLEHTSGQVIWDAQTHNSGMCAAMLTGIAGRMQAVDQNFAGGYKEENYPVYSGGSQNKANQIASLHIGYYGPYFFTERDIGYLNSLNQLLAGLGLLAGLAAVAVGIIWSRRLSRPVVQAIETVDALSRGQYHNSLPAAVSRTRIRELAGLSLSVSRLADTLSRQDQLRKQLTADMAHEIRTPLTTLQSHLEAMLDGIWPADRDHLASCHDEVLRISRLAGDLDQLAAADFAGLSLNRDLIDLAGLASRTAGLLQPAFRQKGINLLLQTEPAPIQADAGRLSQVIMNLLENARKYTPAGGQVTLQVKPEPAGGASLIVTDNGQGIAPEHLPFIFERFYRADPSRHRDTGGSGIGLAIVQSIVRAHGGEVTVSSQPGAGSTFRVTLPGDVQDV